jgi:hypothetical protein
MPIVRCGMPGASQRQMGELPGATFKQNAIFSSFFWIE